MTTDLTQTAQIFIPALATDVFDALLTAPVITKLHSKEGDILEIIPLAGQPGHKGFECATRINAGYYDIRYLDILTRCESPMRLTLDRLPESAFSYDPAERLPPDVGSRDVFLAEPEKFFAAIFGPSPAPQILDFELSRRDGGTLVAFDFSTVTARQFLTGWGKRRALRRIQDDMTMILARLADRVLKP